jgi:hypothetical protein
LRDIQHLAGNCWTLCCRTLSLEHHHGAELCILISKNAEYLESILVKFADFSSALQLFLGSEMAKTLSWKKRCAEPSIVPWESLDEHCELCPLH